MIYLLHLNDAIV